MARINFDLQELQAFVAVAERSSFRAAAEDLHLSQPALSRRIEKLETILGARLLDRTTRHVALTNVGRVFLEHARAALAELESAMLGVVDLAAQLSGLVSVACVPSAAYYFLPSVLKEFAARYPRIRVRVIDEGANFVLNAVTSGRADFGINFIGTQETEVEFRSIFKEDFVLAVRNDHALATRKSVTWEDLAGERFMTVHKDSGNRLLIDAALAKGGKRAQGAFEVSHVLTLLGMVEAGLGVAAVPQLALPLTTHPTLIGIPLMKPRVSRTLGLISRHGHTLSPAASVLYGMLRDAGKAARS
ncbi:LysR family transcriptional regulator [Pigmentiphaga litoralis]|uniref:DNA-binding transcriptional LysR family regulator n=1 Tax=Pigmentiphaga litoralis TaxID=516702 RepID=A0A7Y9ISN4_9BURK|nr:LysR family transcriptional regulator [Pigmentiphaga litoralis]NYE24135.1 DNA-binding transcriptional LysR family regulator [Pigmentiphaga litoralis]NYE82251.1 DNA-binding transcriptional LysR family regulator [Pigmentiphaga litoralis]